MYHFSDAEAIEHDVNTVPGSGDFERVEIDGQWYVPERTCRMEYAGEVPPQIQYSCYFCSECGSPIYNDMEPSYCPYCGARLEDE